MTNMRGKKSRKEKNSGVPVEGGPNTGAPESLESMIARMIRTEMSEKAVKEGGESFEEADDFEEENPDVLPMTHHEVMAMSDEELTDYAVDMGVEVNEEEPAPAQAPHTEEDPQGSPVEEQPREETVPPT